MTEVLFVNSTHKQGLKSEVNGTMLLATKLLHAGIDASVLRFYQIESFLKNDYPSFIREITEHILQVHPKCVSFHTLWPYYHVMLRIAKEIKKAAPEIITVFGGPQASATAEQTLAFADYVDYICTGEGENTVVPFFSALLRDAGPDLSSIPALFYRKDGQIVHNDLDLPLCDLNDLPHWDDRLYVSQYKESEKELTSDTYFMPIDAGRGCPFNCTFCSSSSFWRRTYRLKSCETIIDDILYYNKNFGIRSFWFSHDAFTANKRLVEAVCDEILARGLDIKWRCSTRVDCISKELILKMKEAGLVKLELGIETGSARMQKLINKRLNLQKAVEMIDFLFEQDLSIYLFFIYGFPEETQEDLNQTLELLFTYLDKGADWTSLDICRFNPTTTLTQQYIDQLVLDPKMKVLTHGAFGYEEELDVIRANRDVFPFFYHLDTPLRNEFQYLVVFGYVYRLFPKTIHHLRKLYHGDNLQFYRDFVANNQDLLSMDMDPLLEAVKRDPLTAICNTMAAFDQPYISRLKELMRFECDRKKISEGEEDVIAQKCYGFSFLDFKRNLPIEQYCSGESEIMFQKIGPETRVRLVDIRMSDKE